MTSTPMLSPAQCAAKLGYQPATIIRFIKDGKLPAIKIGRWRIDPEDFAAFLEQHRAERPSHV